MSGHPYLILGTPRSGTFWLSRLLSLAERPCVHEPSRFCTGPDDLAALLKRPRLALADSMLTLRWREIREALPAAHIVVVQRPVAGVVGSFRRAGMWDDNLPELVQMIDREARLLAAQQDVQCITFGALRHRPSVRAVYRTCIGRSLPDHLWRYWSARNEQKDWSATLVDCARNREGIIRTFPELLQLGQHPGASVAA